MKLYMIELLTLNRWNRFCYLTIYWSLGIPNLFQLLSTSGIWGILSVLLQNKCYETLISFKITAVKDISNLPKWLLPLLPSLLHTTFVTLCVLSGQCHISNQSNKANFFSPIYLFSKKAFYIYLKHGSIPGNKNNAASALLCIVFFI